MSKSHFREMTDPLHSEYTFDIQASKVPLSAQTTYEIHVDEDLNDDMVEWFNPLAVDYAPDGSTTLTVAVRDQTELHGLLIKIRDLNLTLIAIKITHKFGEAHLWNKIDQGSQKRSKLTTTTAHRKQAKYPQVQRQPSPGKHRLASVGVPPSFRRLRSFGFASP